MNIGIIGFGRFGKLATKYLAEDQTVKVSTRSDKDTEIRELGAEPVSFEEACKQEILILCVPISGFEDTVKKVVEHVAPETIVVDVCSVKQHPVTILQKYLKNQILATHPIFGPDSAKDSLKGRKITLSNISVTEKSYQKIKQYLTEKELIVLEKTPQEHDREIATSLFLTHFIGRSLNAFGAKPLEIDTEGYKRLLSILETVENDTWQLFEDMHRYNPESEHIYKKFLAASHEVVRRLE